MSSPDISPLLMPIDIGKLSIPTRFALAPMERGWATDGKPSPRYDDYYVERVRNGVGLIIVEITEVDHAPCRSAELPSATRMDESTLPAWQRCVGAVHEAGGKIFVQLSHRGAFRRDDPAGIRSVSPSGILGPGLANGEAATAADLDAIRDAYVRSASVAQRAGFDGIEIQAAHSYLLDQFMWEGSNRRTDGYGGPDIRDRVRFPAEIVAAIRAAVGPEIALCFRFSQYKPVDFAARVAADPDELGVMLDILRGAGTDIFHASALDFDAPAWAGSDRSLAGWTKALTDAPVITVGSIGLNYDVWGSFFTPDPIRNTGPLPIERLLRRFEAGEFDMVAIGRALLGDAAWVTKVRQGRYEDIRPFANPADIADVDVHEFMFDKIVEAYQRHAAA
jgi:2,4-dienoyl-CoA reductase-like NADH-dependent reductase (Old Yellow Enzyme family)